MRISVRMTKNEDWIIGKGSRYMYNHVVQVITCVSRKVSESRPCVICLNPLLARGRNT